MNLPSSKMMPLDLALVTVLRLDPLFYPLWFLAKASPEILLPFLLETKRLKLSRFMSVTSSL